MDICIILAHFPCRCLYKPSLRIHLKEKVVLRNTQLANNTSVDCLVRLWTERYVPDLSTLSSEEGRIAVSQLVEVASPEGRAKTVAKLKRLIQINCECAGIKTNALFSYIPNVVNLTESGRIAKYVAQVYEKALEIYKEQSISLASLTTTSSSFLKTVDFSTNSNVAKEWALPALEMPAMEQLAEMLEPVLLKLREQYISARDRRTIGFITTQFHFSTKLVLGKLTVPEQVLLSPYFKFIEEQVCIPLQRVCKAAAKHSFNSPTLALVRQLLPASRDIASTVYRQAAKLYPNHHSRRGGLNNPAIAVSTIRDLEMFQVYLWLCALEGSATVVEQELLPLCMMVFPSVDVTWELVEQMLGLLVDELMNRLKPEQKPLLMPYTQAMQQLFSNPEKKFDF